MTPMKAMRLKCLECSGGSQKEVRLCPVTSCSLYPYRMGHRPKKDTIPCQDIADDELIEKS